MTSTANLLWIMAALSMMIIFTRSLPFLFTRWLKHSHHIKLIGQNLPAHIMLMLVIFELPITIFFNHNDAIPAMLALAALVIVHAWRREMILSLCVGLLIYSIATKVVT